MSVAFSQDDIPDDGAEVLDNPAPTTRPAPTVHKGIEKKLTTIPDLNKRFGLLEVPGQGLAFVNRQSRSLMSDHDLNTKLANEVVKGLRATDDHGTVLLPAADAFKGNIDRHSYTKIMFTKKPVEDHVFNLYRGIGVTPKVGDCSLLLKHIDHVICNGDKKKAVDLSKLMAWQLQNIGDPSRVVVVLYSEYQQLGKGILCEEVLGKIYGPSFIKPANMEQVTGRFNSCLCGVGCVFLDEVMFGGDHRAANALKSLVTSGAMSIEPKMLPIIQSPIGLNFFLATNNQDGVRIEKHDRRYWVFDVREERMPDAYFKALMAEINSGGREAFAYYLMNMDITGFVPWVDINKDNAAKSKMINATVNDYDMDKWLEECYLSHQIVGMNTGFGRGADRLWKDGDEVSSISLLKAYKEWQTTVKGPTRAKPTANDEFWRKLTVLGLIDCGRSSAGRKRVLPSIDRLAHLAGVSVSADVGEGVSDGGMFTDTHQVSDLSKLFDVEILSVGECQ
jgi:hypothetical protein